MTDTFVAVATLDGKSMPSHFFCGGSDARTTLILLYEIYGMNDNIRSTARMFAEQGYDVIVPDFFWRQEPGVELDPARPVDRKRALALMGALDEANAVSDVLALAAHIRGEKGSSRKIGVVGYCVGGKLAYLIATLPGIDASVSYYGVGIQSAIDQVVEVQAPLLLHIAEADELCPPEAQAAIHKAVKSHATISVLDYPSVGHAFARLGGSNFDAASANRANDESFMFLAQYLK